MKNSALYTAAVVFAIVSTGHWIRFFRADEVLLAGHVIPVWWSLLFGALALGLAGWMLIAARR